MNRISNWFFLSGKDFNFLRTYQFRRFQMKAEATRSTKKNENLSSPSEIDMKEDTSMKVVFSELFSSNKSSTSTSLVPDQIQPPKNDYMNNHTRGKGNAVSTVMYEGSFHSLKSVQEAIEVIKFLSIKGQRFLKTLNMASDKICSSDKILELKDCSTVFYAMAVLNFKNKDLLDKLSQSIILKQSEFHLGGKLPASILHSIGILQYRNCELIEILLKTILEKKDLSTSEMLLKGFLTLAVVNWSTPYSVVLYNELSKCNEKDFHHTKSYLDFVWASVLLNNYSVEHMSTVLSENFINKLNILGDKRPNLKLININGAATTLLESYNGPYLNKTQYDPPQTTNAKYQFLRSVLDTLNHVLPTQGHFNTNVDTRAGFSLDIECFLDKKNNPALAKKKETSKIGIMLLEFNDFCLGDQENINGLTSFKLRILAAKGYKIILVPFFEFNNSMKLQNKIEYLEKKIQDVCDK